MDVPCADSGVRGMGREKPVVRDTGPEDWVDGIGVRI
jgi:hypothetical protein